MSQPLFRFHASLSVPDITAIVAFFFALIMTHSPVLAKVEIYQFDQPKDEALYRELIQELRCLVCQNQNLADSNAELAIDLRRRTRELILQGKSRQEIVDYMVDRYGDFVLYRPPFNRTTLLLWLSPLLLAAVVLVVAFRSRNRRKIKPTVYSEEEMAKARKLMQEDD